MEVVETSRDYVANYSADPVAERHAEMARLHCPSSSFSLRDRKPDYTSTTPPDAPVRVFERVRHVVLDRHPEVSSELFESLSALLRNLTLNVRSGTVAHVTEPCGAQAGMPEMKAALGFVGLGAFGVISMSSALVIAVLAAVIAAVWEGVRPQVVAFARDASIDWFRDSASAPG